MSRVLWLSFLLPCWAFPAFAFSRGADGHHLARAATRMGLKAERKAETPHRIFRDNGSDKVDECESRTWGGVRASTPSWGPWPSGKRVSSRLSTPQGSRARSIRFTALSGQRGNPLDSAPPPLVAKGASA